MDMIVSIIFKTGYENSHHSSTFSFHHHSLKAFVSLSVFLIGKQKLRDILWE